MELQMMSELDHSIKISSITTRIVRKMIMNPLVFMSCFRVIIYSWYFLFYYLYFLDYPEIYSTNSYNYFIFYSGVSFLPALFIFFQRFFKQARTQSDYLAMLSLIVEMVLDQIVDLTMTSCIKLAQTKLLTLTLSELIFFLLSQAVSIIFLILTSKVSQQGTPLFLTVDQITTLSLLIKNIVCYSVVGALLGMNGILLGGNGTIAFTFLVQTQGESYFKLTQQQKKLLMLRYQRGLGSHGQIEIYLCQLRSLKQQRKELKFVLLTTTSWSKSNIFKNFTTFNPGNSKISSLTFVQLKSLRVLISFYSLYLPDYYFMSSSNSTCFQTIELPSSNQSQKKIYQLLTWKVRLSRSQVASLEKKDLKTSYPFTVVTLRALSLNKDIDIFYSFLMSALGIFINVYPKNIVFELNLEQKHIRWLVIQSLPASMILSEREQEQLLMYFQLYSKVIFLRRNSAFLLFTSPKKIYFPMILFKFSVAQILLSLFYIYIVFVALLGICEAF